MKTTINFSREAGCSLFLSIFTCLFWRSGLTNRNCTHLVKVLWSHPGVGAAISQTSISSSPVVLALWDPRMKTCSWHSCSSTELKDNWSPESFPWSPNPTAYDDMGITCGGEGIAGTRLFVDAECVCTAFPEHYVQHMWCQHMVLPIFLHTCSLPLPSQRKAGLVISANHQH